jgi:hypothetical protein
MFSHRGHIIQIPLMQGRRLNVSFNLGRAESRINAISYGPIAITYIHVIIVSIYEIIRIDIQCLTDIHSAAHFNVVGRRQSGPRQID